MISEYGSDLHLKSLLYFRVSASGFTRLSHTNVRLNEKGRAAAIALSGCSALKNIYAE